LPITSSAFYLRNKPRQTNQNVSIIESFTPITRNYEKRSCAFFVRNSQNGINENNKNGVLLIG